MTLEQKRDSILSSLRDQFRTKVASIALKQSMTKSGPGEMDAFLVDLANNIAQGLAEED